MKKILKFAPIISSAIAIIIGLFSEIFVIDSEYISSLYEVLTGDSSEFFADGGIIGLIVFLALPIISVVCYTVLIFINNSKIKAIAGGAVSVLSLISALIMGLGVILDMEFNLYLLLYCVLFLYNIIMVILEYNMENAFKSVSFKSESYIPVNRIEVQESIPVQKLDEETVSVPKLEEETIPVQKLDEETVPVQKLDEETVPVQKLDEETVPVQKLDEETVPVQKLDEETVPVQKMDIKEIPPKPDVKNSLQTEITLQTFESVELEIPEESPPAIKCLRGDFATAVFPCEGTLIIGSSSKMANIVLNGSLIDTNHCSVCYSKSENGYFIVDYSKTGTYLVEPSVRIPSNISILLSRGTVINLGDDTNSFLLV